MGNRVVADYIVIVRFIRITRSLIVNVPLDIKSLRITAAKKDQNGLMVNVSAQSEHSSIQLQHSVSPAADQVQVLLMVFVPVQDSGIKQFYHFMRRDLRVSKAVFCFISMRQVC